MSKHAGFVNKVSWFSVLHRVARFFGRCLCILGWFCFFSAFLGAVLEANPTPENRDVYYSNASHSFLIAGYCITSGWLLSRLATGLFPFGRRMFK